MATNETHNLALRIEAASGPLVLDVRDFAVRAEMNRPYEIDVTAASSDAAIDLDTLVGLPATFAITSAVGVDLASMLRDAGTTDQSYTDQGVRRWTGLVAEIRQVSAETEGLSYYRAHIVPPLWLLTQRTDTRIFQHISELEVVLNILQRWGIEPNVVVDLESHRRREYRTQYEESDFDFVNRMMEEAGISYYFESNFGQTGRMVITDSPTREAPRPRPLTFQDTPMAAQGLEWASAVEQVRRVAPGRVALVDHDFRRPTNVPILATARDGLPVEDRLEMFEYRDGHFLYVQGSAGDAEDPGDQRGPARTDEREAQILAVKRLRSLRARARETHFTTNAYDIDLGDIVKIEGHTRTELGEEGLLVTELTLTGGANSEWQLDVIGTSAAEIYRPPLRTPRPVASGVESATVVGPDPNKSHKDRHGRIFVHFHWDRDEFADEYTTCWMHVSQPWGGANYGAGMMPRPGQEVIVSFFGSDPDRPIVVGRYHTSIQKPLFRYPSPDEEGGIISWSDDGGGGSNKMTWKDRAGQELLAFQAQRDKQTLVKRNSGTTVRSNQSNSVGSNRTMYVRGVESRRVDGNRTNAIGQSQANSIQQNSFTQTNQGAIVQNACTAHVTTAQGSSQDTAVIQKFVVGGSAIVITPALIMIKSAKVHINPSDADARSIIETGMTAADAAAERQAAERREQNAAEQREVNEQRAVLDRRQAEINQMPIPSRERAEAQAQLDAARRHVDGRQANLDNPFYQPRPFPSVFGNERPIPLLPGAPVQPYPITPQTPGIPGLPSGNQPLIQNNPYITPGSNQPSIFPTYQPRPFPLGPT